MSLVAPFLEHGVERTCVRTVASALLQMNNNNNDNDESVIIW